MTCTPFNSGQATGFVCVDDTGRLSVAGRYVWVDYHHYCGPTFFTDMAMSKFYEPVDEDDPVWSAFTAWLEKRDAAKARLRARQTRRLEAQKVRQRASQTKGSRAARAALGKSPQGDR